MASDSVDDGKPAYSAPALSKGLEVLELLAESRAPLTMKAISDGLKRSKNEIFRMVIALQERGYIARDAETDAYSLTDRLFKLGLHTPRAQDLVSLAVPEMQMLADECKQSPHLVVVNHGVTVVTAAVPGGDDMAFTLTLGYGRIATNATSGQTILAFQPPEKLKGMIAQSAALSSAPIDVVELLLKLEAIRERGYEMHDSRDFVGITDICCPIFGPDNNAIACIIIAYVNRHTRESHHDRTLGLVQAACRRISLRLSPRLRSQQD